MTFHSSTPRREDACGCAWQWSIEKGFYVRVARCGVHTVQRERAERLKAIQASHDASRRREDCPIWSKPFSLWRR
jgi:hypothetical protein